MTERKTELNTKLMVFASAMIKWRYLVVLLSILLAFGIASGGKNLKFATDYNLFFGEENEFLKTFNHLQNTYSRTDNVLIALVPKSGNVFTSEFLSAMEVLTEKSWETPYSIRVDSLTNFQHVAADEEGLIIKNLVENAQSYTVQQLRTIAEVAQNEPLLMNKLVTKRANIAGINIAFHLPDGDITANAKVAGHVRETLAAFKVQYPDIDYYTSGQVMFSNTFGEVSEQDMGSLIPLMYLVILVLLSIFMRTFFGMLGTLLIIVFCTMVAMGVAGFLSFQLTAISLTATTIIMTIAVADSIHILRSMLNYMRAGMEKNEAMLNSIHHNFKPVFLTSLTTAIGFLGLYFIDSPPFHDLGVITAVGVVAAFFYTFTFLPAFIAIMPIKVKVVEVSGDESLNTVMAWIAEWVIARRNIILIGSLGVIVFVSFFIPKLEVNDNFLEYFDESVEFRHDSDFIAENMTGLFNIEFSLRSEEGGNVYDPEYMKVVDQFTQWLRQQPEVLNVDSITDRLKRINQNLNGGNEKFYQLPQKKDLISQYFLLYESSLPQGLGITNQVSINKKETKVTAVMADSSSVGLKLVKQRAEQWLTENAPQSMFAQGSGLAMMFAYLTDTNIKGLIQGAAVTLLFITIILVVTFRSVKYGLLSLVLNALPIVLAYGFWYFISNEIGLAAATVSTLTLGIVVDDSIHFMSRYLHAKSALGMDAENSIRSAFDGVGAALFTTTAVLICGFSVLAASAYKMNWQMGGLAALTIAIALIVDFLICPAMLLLLDGKKKKLTEEDVLPSI